MDPGEPIEPRAIRPGDYLAKRYRVERALSGGGNGLVFAARDLSLDEEVAIKVPRPHLLARPGAADRFVREAKILARLKSPYVTRVLDAGLLEGGEPYLVMELLDGATLKDWLHRQGALPVPQAVEILRCMCAGLTEAHALGVVHRDLKPSNVFCTLEPDGELAIKILDFGISKAAFPEIAGPWAPTPDGAIIGSPHYMSPEQIRSAAEVDARSDVWALGVILFELVTGRTPFVAETLVELAIQVTTHRTPSPRRWRRDLDPQLEAAILRCLEKERAARYQSVSELADALGASTLGRVDNTTAVDGDSLNGETTDDPRTTLQNETQRQKLGRRVRGAIVAALVFALILIVRSRFPDLGAPTESVGATASHVGPVAATTAPPAPGGSQTAQSATASLPAAPNPTASALADAVRPKGSGPLAGAASRPRSDRTDLKRPAIKTNCLPPYFIDDAGNRVFRSECVE